MTLEPLPVKFVFGEPAWTAVLHGGPADGKEVLTQCSLVTMFGQELDDQGGTNHFHHYQCLKPGYAEYVGSETCRWTKTDSGSQRA